MTDATLLNGSTLSPTNSTPLLTINQDVAADLDSSNAFEGMINGSFDYLDTQTNSHRSRKTPRSLVRAESYKPTSRHQLSRTKVSPC